MLKFISIFVDCKVVSAYSHDISRSIIILKLLVSAKHTTMIEIS